MSDLTDDMNRVLAKIEEARMNTTEVGTHIFGSGSAGEEPDHLRVAREHQDKRKEIQARLNAALGQLTKEYNAERTRITHLFDAEFKQAALDAGLK